MTITVYKNGILFENCVILSFSDIDRGRAYPGVELKTREDMPEGLKSYVDGLCFDDDTKIITIHPSELSAYPKARFYRHLYRRTRHAIAGCFFKFLIRQTQAALDQQDQYGRGTAPSQIPREEIVPEKDTSV